MRTIFSACHVRRHTSACTERVTKLGFTVEQHTEDRPIPTLKLKMPLPLVVGSCAKSMSSVDGSL